ncbi:MAG TPA: hypothetical protein VJ044_04535, partial [Candidatus Hodarchaeales archaeon]|nr:hypothetical protein [Candidatus Hodarchaeales archaeon]
MNLKNRLALLAVLMIACCLALTDLDGQDRSGEIVDVFTKQKDQAAERIQGWETKGNILVGLTILIGVLGAFIAIPKEWKTAKIIAGFLVSVITVMNNTIFEVDHRTYWKLANDGMELLAKLELDLVSYKNASEEDKELLYKSITSNLSEITRLEKKFHEKVSTAVNSFELGVTAPAYAAASGEKGEPRWLARLPRDTESLYFVGVDYSTTLVKAKEYSLRDARGEAASYLLFEARVESGASKSSIDLADLSAILETSSAVEVADTYYSYDNRNRIYYYYTLLKLHKSSFSLDYKYGGGKKQSSISFDLGRLLYVA